MKPVVTCELIHGVPTVGQRGYVRRTSDHPVLGQPRTETTHTSRVLRVDTENRVIETLNTLYLYK